MIPDFKTFIKESLFGNMANKGRGEVVKKEDDINNLDLHELCDYLNQTYKSTTPGRDITVENFEEYGECLTICLYEDESGYYRYLYYDGSNVTTECDVFEAVFNGCLSEVKEKYSTISYKNEFGIDEIDIYPKDKARVPITNTFLIEVLDFILDKIDIPLTKQIEKKNVNESLFGNMSDKGRGEVVKKEDNINLLDRDDFYKYIMKHYKTATEDVTGPYAIINSKNADYINIPILEDGINTLYRVIIWNFDKDVRYITIPMKEPFWGSKLFVKMRDTFKLKSVENQFNPLFKVFPKDNKKVDNKFFLEVIDFIIDNAEEPFEPLLTRI